MSALIEGHSKAYVQAVSRSRDRWESYDRARSVFVDSGIPDDERFTVVANGSKLDSQLIRGIEQHSAVIFQDDVPAWLDRLAA